MLVVERFEAAPGLGGSGRLGMLDEVLMVAFMLGEEPDEPRNMADIGCLCSHTRRVVLI